MPQLLIIPIYLFVDPRLKQLSEDKLNEWKKWFDSRLDNAIEMTEIETQLENAESMWIHQKF